MGFASIILIQFADAIKELVLVAILCFFCNPKAIKERCNAEFPEFVDTAYFVPIYFENSSSNLKTLSPKTSFSFWSAHTAASIDFLDKEI